MVVAGGIPLDEIAEDMKSARALIQSGEARLEAVVWPWGLEFYLVAAASQGPPLSMQSRRLCLAPGKDAKEAGEDGNTRTKARGEA